jgi:hypothetical protein
MEPFGHRESSLFAEPTENKSFSERNPVFFSTKLEMIRFFVLILGTLAHFRHLVAATPRCFRCAHCGEGFSPFSLDLFIGFS